MEKQKTEVDEPRPVEYRLTEEDLARILGKIAEAQSTRRPTPPDTSGPTEAQKQLVTQFRLLRNGIGILNNNGESIDRFLLRTPTFRSAGKAYEVTFHGELPRTREQAHFTVQGGGETRVPLVAPDRTVTISEPPTRVDLLDCAGTLLAVGFPVQAPDRGDVAS